jgi:hypothetical protein
MKFAGFQRDGDGNLKMNLGRGHRARPRAKDY